jgi:hypothetical protein
MRFAAIELRSSRSFVPDHRQKNGDLRLLSLRIYSIRVDRIERATSSR